MKKLIRESDIIVLVKNGIKELVIDKNTIMTSLAVDKCSSSKIKIIRVEKIEDKTSGSASNGRIFSKIVVGSDHTGVNAKEVVVKLLKESGYEVIDIGTFTEESCDYPDFAFIASAKVLSKEACAGILIDATEFLLQLRLINSPV